MAGFLDKPQISSLRGLAIKIIILTIENKEVAQRIRLFIFCESKNGESNFFALAKKSVCLWFASS